MRKKLMLIIFVLMFGLVGNLSAADWNWTGGGADALWTTFGNWDSLGYPDATDASCRFDGALPTGIIDGTMDLDVDYLLVGRGTAATASVTMNGGELRIHNRAYMADSTDSGAVGIVTLNYGTIKIMGTHSGDRKFYVGYKGGTVNTAKGYFNMNGGLLDDVGKFYIAGEKSGADVGWGQVTMTGGTINVDEGSARVRIGGKGGTGSLIMSGGTLYSADDVIIADGTGSTGTLTMTGGEIIADGDFKVGSGDSGSAVVQLYGGIIRTNNLQFDKDLGSMDITLGAMVIAGDEVAEVEDLVTGGYITAFGGAGNVCVGYHGGWDATVVGACIPEPATIALLGLGGLSLLRRRK
jgi:hypothetical protein